MATTTTNQSQKFPCPNDILRSLAPPPRAPQPIQCHGVVGCGQEVPPTSKSATIGRRAPEIRLVSSGASSHRDRPSAAAMEFAAQRGSR